MALEYTSLSPATPGGDKIAVDALPGDIKASATKILLGADGTDGGFLTPSNPLPVALDAASLAALENTSAAVSGTVAISGTVEVANDAGSPLPVAGTVDLGATSLAALESISAAVSGTVAVSGSVEIANDSGNPLPVASVASEIHLGAIGGETALASVEFARPADTIAYTTGDVVGPAAAAVQVLANAARLNGGSGYITKTRLIKNSVGVGDFRVYFFTSPPAAIADNSPFPLLWANRAARIGHIDLSLSSEAGGSDCAGGSDLNTRIAFVCAPGSAALYAVIVAKSGYVPVSGEPFYLEVTIERN